MKVIFEVANQMQVAGIIGRYAIGGAVGATYLDIFVALPFEEGRRLLSLSPIYEFLEASRWRRRA